MFKCIFMLLKPRENFWPCVRANYTLKNCTLVRKQHLDHRMHLVTWNVLVVTCSNLTIQNNYRTRRIPRHCCPNHHRSASMFHRRKQAFKIIGFLGHSLNINPAWCWEQCDGRIIWLYYIFATIRCPSFMIINPSFPPFSIVFRNQRFRNCSSTVDVGFVKLSLDCVFKINIEFCCHLCCSSSMIFKHNSS
jgi:hypothetical protein